MLRLISAFLLRMTFVTLPCSVYSAEEIDLEAIHKIRQEAFGNSQVMEHIYQLTDVNGPRLSQSPGYNRAAHHLIGVFKDWGLSNIALESFGEFGRGWELDYYSAHMTKPYYARLPGSPLAWTGSTDGEKTAEVVIATFFDRPEALHDIWDLNKLERRVEQYMSEYRGKLRDKIVLLDWQRKIPRNFGPLSQRLTDEKLKAISRITPPEHAEKLEFGVRKLNSDGTKRMAALDWTPYQTYLDFFIRRMEVRDRFNEFLGEEGVIAVVHSDSRGPGHVTFAEYGGSFLTGAVIPPPKIKLPVEAYGRLFRLVERKVPVLVSLNVQNTFYEDDTDGKNVIAELRGTRKAEELVMVGGHLDSWHAGTGAADNAAGVAVAMEAVRILKTLELPLDRTIRLALWGGEEQAILGSIGYMDKHFYDSSTGQVTPDHARLSAYYNLDHGAGKIRGVYLQGNNMVRPIFKKWMEPLADLGVNTFTIAQTHLTDHIAFDQIGLPGFQFIQDPLDYYTLVLHSELDVPDHLIASDLKQASAVMATFLYLTANREELLPRKPLPPSIKPH